LQPILCRANDSLPLSLTVAAHIDLHVSLCFSRPLSVSLSLALSLSLVQDPVLAELLHSFKEFLVCYHEHDSLLDHKESEALSEEDRKAAWTEYEAEKKVSDARKGGGVAC